MSCKFVRYLTSGVPGDERSIRSRVTNIHLTERARDYADMNILRNIRPEDIEDVSERYVPLYSTERESDTVKKVEYNVSMQILRYMVHIWEDYEKEMNAQNPKVSGRKDFRYPPVLPIVYYEGKARWTADFDLADRILCRELLNKYLPHLKYQLVRLHDYSNEELLAKGDEISLAMMINKIQCAEDISAFMGVPQEEVDRILKDTPDYLLDIMSKVMRALLYSMDLSESETESVVSKIKERKMGQLFEQVPKNLRAERKKWKKEAEAEHNAMRAERDKVCAERDEAFAKRDAVYAELSAVKREMAIQRYIYGMSKKGISGEEIRISLMEKFSLTAEQAEEKFAEAFEEQEESTLYRDFGRPQED